MCGGRAGADPRPAQTAEKPHGRTRRPATAIASSSLGSSGPGLSSHRRHPGPSAVAGLPSNDSEVTPGAAAASRCRRQGGNAYGNLRGREGRGSGIAGSGREIRKVAEGQRPSGNLFSLRDARITGWGRGGRDGV